MSAPLNISDYFKKTRLGGIPTPKTPSVQQEGVQKTEFESILNALKTQGKQSNGSGSEAAQPQRFTLKDYRMNTVRNQSLSALSRMRNEDLLQAPSGKAESDKTPLKSENTTDLKQTDFARAMKRINGQQKHSKNNVRQRIDSCIELASQKYDVPSELIRGIIKAESGFKPDVVSPAGARGLMQLMPGTAEDLGVKNPFDIYENIDGGVRYFKQMMNKFDGDVKLSLAAYNAGPGAVERYEGVPPYRETQRYIRKVMKYSDDIT